MISCRAAFAQAQSKASRAKAALNDLTLKEETAKIAKEETEEKLKATVERLKEFVKRIELKGHSS